MAMRSLSAARGDDTKELRMLARSKAAFRRRLLLALGVSTLGAAFACQTLIGIEPDHLVVQNRSDGAADGGDGGDGGDGSVHEESFVFPPSCAAAQAPLLCDDNPDPSWWDLPIDGGSCKFEAGSPRGLAASCLPSTGAPLEPWCAIRSFDQRGLGFRMSLAFRVEAAQSTQGFAVLGIVYPDDYLIVESSGSALQARVGYMDAPTPIGPLDSDWHHLGFHATPAGIVSLVFDGRLIGAFHPSPPGQVVVELRVLDSSRADVPATVTVDDVIVLPY
jgi:hypothetical protein